MFYRWKRLDFFGEKMKQNYLKKKTKRLKPKNQMLRELYLKSGNQCAFLGCNNP